MHAFRLAARREKQMTTRMDAVVLFQAGEFVAGILGAGNLDDRFKREFARVGA